MQKKHKNRVPIGDSSSSSFKPRAWVVRIRSLLCDKSLANGSERPVPRDPSAIPRGSRIPWTLWDPNPNFV
jgi:hypothetical protein